MSQKCMICWVTCTTCRWWHCRCWYTPNEVKLSNEILTEEWIVSKADYRKRWIHEMVMSWMDKYSIKQALLKWLPEEEQIQYIPVMYRNVEYTEEWKQRCKYTTQWVRAKCVYCWVSRRDKQHVLEKSCSWIITNQNEG